MTYHTKPEEILKQVGLPILKTVYDPNTDDTIITVKIEGKDIQRIAYGDEGVISKFFVTIDRETTFRALNLWYLKKRPKPHLCAGLRRR